ncbi:MAG: hypothetical protein PVF82_15305 [Gammaproteobacteria bacterium]|jgi:hypothetical protein
MSPNIDLIACFYLMGAAQSVVFVVLLLKVSCPAHRANRYLAAIPLTFALALVGKFLIYTRHFRDVPQLLGVYIPLDFACGPLVYSLLKSVNLAAFCVDMKGWAIRRL